MNLDQIHKVYFMGIGGIGMSALARFFKLKGKEVKGYDRVRSPLCMELEKEGIEIVYDLNQASPYNDDLLIYTPAISTKNPVMVNVDRSGMPFIKRSEALGLICESYKTIAVAGTHGKTSTTGLTAHLLRSGGVDATGFIGGIVNNFRSNFVFGESDFIVVEADEFDRSFLKLKPDYAAITSIDADHLDIYGDHDQMKESFAGFANQVNASGSLILNERLQSFAQGLSKNVLFYGLENGDFKATDIRFEGLKTFFAYESENERFEGLELSFPGRHNLENAVAAITLARHAGADPEGIKEGLKSFEGIWRRLDVQYSSSNMAYIDDYAHHPEEIRALLGAVKEMFPGWKLVAVFQPHLYSRTRDFADGFGEALSIADSVALMPIYPAREEPIPGVSSQLILDNVTANEKTMTSREELVSNLEKFKVNKCVVLSVGAGDIDREVNRIKEQVIAWDNEV